MPRYKLFRLFNTLSKPERSEVEKYIAANGQPDCTALFASLKNRAPNEWDAAVVKQELFKNSFPGRDYDDARMRKLMTYLTRLMEDFLVQKELSADQTIRHELLARSLARRSDYQLFKDAVKHGLLESESGQNRGTQYFRQKSLLLQSLYFHPQTPKYGNNVPDYFSQASESREWYFALESLLAGTESMARGRTFANEYSSLFFDSVMATFAQRRQDCPAVVSFFLHIAKLLSTRIKMDDLEPLKAELSAVFPMMGLLEKRMALKLMTLYATPFSNNGDREYSRFLFEVFRLGIDHHLLQHGENAIASSLFINVAVTGIMVGEFQWTTDFMQTYIDCLPKEDRHNAWHLSLAVWHYNKGLVGGEAAKFDEALRLLSRIPTHADGIFELRVRSLELRIQFDAFRSGSLVLDELLAKARNFELHLERSANYSAEKKTAYRSFIGHFRRLARLVNQPERSKGEVESFMKKLLADEDCILRHWLEEKAGALLPPTAGSV